MNLFRIPESIRLLSNAHYPPTTKARLLWQFKCQRGRVLDYRVSYFSEDTFRFLFKEIFLGECYRFSSSETAPLIFDCGSNIGMATLYFKSILPDARIIAFEPDPSTFQLFVKNVRANQLRDVESHNVALWERDENVALFVGESGPGSLLMSTDSHRLPGRELTVPGKRLSTFINAPIDFLKMDIEGAEEGVLSEVMASGKMEWVRRGLVEYHHRIPGRGSRLGKFLQVLEASGFDYEVAASLPSVTAKNEFQDVAIGFYRT